GVYRAPEALSGQIDGIGEHLDIFSLGCLAYFLFTGRPPADTPTDVAELVREHDGLKLSAVLDGQPEKLQRLVQNATRPLPTDRFATVEEVLSDLDDLDRELRAPSLDGLPDPTEATAGNRIEHGFEVKKRLGSGSTAVAFLVARDTEPECVLKVAHTLANNDRLREEAAVIKKLHHHHIVSCDGVLEFQTRDGPRVGILLQNAGEQTLGKRIAAVGPLQAELLERFGEDLLSTVQYMEGHGVVHRDIKPENIGVTELRRGGKLHLMLFDFSLASTSASVINVGTHPYLDPFLQDRARRHYDSHAERYAVAMTLYEMATAHTAVWGERANDPFVTNAEARIEGDLMDSAIREPLARFFKKAFARSFKDRFD
ncbi:MAG: protein kinase, partial [Planctomycetota bacterium]|nr:protein kinase [Planctomycetota bacterium]